MSDSIVVMFDLRNAHGYQTSSNFLAVTPRAIPEGLQLPQSPSCGTAPARSAGAVCMALLLCKFCLTSVPTTHSFWGEYHLSVMHPCTYHASHLLSVKRQEVWWNNEREVYVMFHWDSSWSFPHSMDARLSQTTELHNSFLMFSLWCHPFTVTEHNGPHCSTLSGAAKSEFSPQPHQFHKTNQSCDPDYVRCNNWQL